MAKRHKCASGWPANVRGDVEGQLHGIRIIAAHVGDSLKERHKVANLEVESAEHYNPKLKGDGESPRK
jgi:hypothetical protein